MPNGSVDSQIFSNRARAERAVELTSQSIGINPDYVSIVEGQKPNDYVDGTGPAFGSYPVAGDLVQPVVWNDNTNQWDDFGSAKPTKAFVDGVKSDLQEDINSEAQARSDGDSTLQENINSVSTSLQQEINAKVNAEASARSDADGTLQSNIDSEATARSGGDSTLQSDINSEAQARADADSALQSDIDTEIQDRTAADGVLQASITNVDADLQGQVDDLFNSQTGGLVGYATKANMDADGSQPANTIALVTNDSTPANNGYYRYNGSSWVRRDSFFSSELNVNNDSDAITGRALEFLSVQPLQKYTNADLDSEPPTFGTGTFRSLYGAIKGIRLYGVDNSKIYKIARIARNHATNGYRVRIKSKAPNGVNWEDAIDSRNTTGLFNITETNPYTSFRFENAKGQAVEMLIDYSAFDDETITIFEDNPETDDPAFIINPDNVINAKSSFSAFTLFDNESYDVHTPDEQVGVEIGKLYAAIKSVHLYGFDPNKLYKIRRIARNAEVQNYRVVFSSKYPGESSWSIELDTGIDFTVTETNPETHVTYTAPDGRVFKMVIDYSPFPTNPNNDEVSYVDFEALATDDPLFIISQDFIYAGSSVPDDLQINSIAANEVKSLGPVPTGTLASPPTGLAIGDQWADTTQSADHPTVRVAQVAT